MYKFTVLKSDPITNNALPAFLKSSEHSQETSAMESVFRIVMSGVDWKAPIIY